MRILILGANAFSASCLIDSLLTADHRVLGISRNLQKKWPLNCYIRNSNLGNLTFLKRDLNKDFDTLVAEIHDFAPEIIVDFAGQGMVAESWISPEQWFETNVISKIKLLQKFRNLDSLIKYIRISTPEVYGSTTSPLKENSTYFPSTPYALTHSTIDEYLRLNFQQHNFPFVIGRFANFYGPTQDPYRIVPKFIVTALKSEKFPLHGGGISKRSFIYEDDFVAGIIAMIEKGISGRTYHFSGNEIVTIKGLVVQISLMLNLEPNTIIRQVEDRPGKDLVYQMDDTDTQLQLSWSPVHHLREGLDSCIQHIRQNWDFYKNCPLEYRHQK